MKNATAIVRNLRERAPQEAFATAGLPGAGLDIVAVEVTAVDEGAIPPTHDVIMLDRVGEQIPGTAITGAIMAGAGSAAVGSKMLLVELPSSDLLLIAGGGGSSGGSSGSILPHSHMGGADGPVISMTGTL